MENREYLLTEARPYNFRRTPKNIFIDAGRVSTGAARIFTGNIISATPTQPPDIGVTMRCFTGHFFRNTIISNAQEAIAPLSGIAGDVATELGLTTVFEATDKNIKNYSFNGGAEQQIAKIGDAGGVNAFIDDETLVVKDFNVPLSGGVRLLSEGTGMIGTPELTELGVKVAFLLDTTTRVGSGIQIESIRYPVANGQYVIYKLTFDITSRDTPFYYIAEAKRIGEF